MDFTSLRQQGIRHLERLAGQQWTDFNVHDPGITILEQLCYVLTDLVYRIDHEMPDLLAEGGGDPYASLYPPHEILSTRAVTRADLRKAALDVPWIQNAWIEPVDEDELELHFHPGPRELDFTAAPFVSEPVTLQGLSRVWIELSDRDKSEKALPRVVRRLHTHRNLCEDFVDIATLTPRNVPIHGTVEIGPVEDVDRLLASIYVALAGEISPRIPFVSLEDRLASGVRVDEIFDGPLLDHGFIDDGAFMTATRRTRLNASDLVHAMMDVSDVRAVRDLELGTTREPWTLRLDYDEAPKLDTSRSEITLVRAGLTVTVDKERTERLYAELRSRATAPSHRRDALAPPTGRDRKVERYRSLQHHFPAAYGIGPTGLPPSATPERQARARQLEAYLLLFDRLLADAFAQLGHAGDLYSFHGDDLRTYFAGRLDDPDLHVDELILGGEDQGRRAIEKLTEDADDSRSERKNRFLNHLLARFAEAFADHAAIQTDDRSPAGIRAGDKLARDKQAFLRDYPRLSSGRGTAFNVLEPPGPDNRSGLEARIRHRIGLLPDEGPLVIEHVLLRPVAEDRTQTVPFLVHAASADVFSHQLSLVFLETPRFGEAEGDANHLRRFVEQTVRNETPAHLVPRILWLGEDDWRTFHDAWDSWLGHLRESRRKKQLGTTEANRAETAGLSHHHVRATRDRVIDLLGVGQTHPLQDPEVGDLKVPFGQTAKILIVPGQSDVNYELRESDDLSVPAFADAEGTGATTVLETPPITEDVTYSILAYKRDDPGRSAWLHQTATVRVGLDTSLSARIDARPLDPSHSNPADTAPRIVDFGTSVDVEIDDAQEGVDYRLVEERDGGEIELSIADVGGLGPDTRIVLRSRPMVEDTSIRIRATRAFDAADGGATASELLEIELPLAVRAHLAAEVTAVSSVIPLGASTMIAVADTQTNAEYRLWGRTLADSDFVYGDPDGDVLEISVDGEPDVMVPPPPSDLGVIPRGYVSLGDWRPGDGGELRLDTMRLDDDTLVIVQARKTHWDVGTSLGQLARAAVVLTEPDATVALALTVPVTPRTMSGRIGVTGGVPGVFYTLRRGATGADREPPAYFHQLDPADPEENKGVGLLRIEGDFALAREPRPEGKVPTGVPPFVRPPEPLLEFGGNALDLEIHIRAMKARTRVSVELSRVATIAEPPDIRFEEEVVNTGTPARILVLASRVGERYEPFLDGVSVKRARHGNGEDLVFVTEPVVTDTTFEVHIDRPGDLGLPVTRIFQLTVTVR